MSDKLKVRAVSGAKDREYPAMFLEIVVRKQEIGCIAVEVNEDDPKAKELQIRYFRPGEDYGNDPEILFALPLDMLKTWAARPGYSVPQNDLVTPVATLKVEL